MTSLPQAIPATRSWFCSKGALHALIVVAALFVALPTSASCTGAVIATNPITGLSEKVWQEHDGQDYEIRHAEQLNGSWVGTTQLTVDALDQTCPALGFDGDGATAVVWKSSTSPSRIYYRERRNVSGSWVWQSSAVAVTDGSCAASTPFVAFHQGTVWVVWREAGSGGTVRIVVANDPGGEPWPSNFDVYLLTTISDPGYAALDVNSESGSLWATWMANTTSLQYAEWDASSWSWFSPASVTIENGDLAAAKAQARLNVLN